MSDSQQNDLYLFAETMNLVVRIKHFEKGWEETTISCTLHTAENEPSGFKSKHLNFSLDYVYMQATEL